MTQKTITISISSDIRANKFPICVIGQDVQMSHICSCRLSHIIVSADGSHGPAMNL